MNSLNRVRSSLYRTLFSVKNSNTNSDSIPQEGFSILNHNFSSYHHFDLSTNSQQQSETSLQTINQSHNTSIIDKNGDDIELLQHSSKRTLRTIPGVFCPIALSMFAISIFMRIGFVLAHAGVLQTLLQLSLCFIILLATLLSVCSLATNGAIEGGGVYHMISRTLGPEFGGAIGLLFFFANVICNGQSVAALVEALVESFGPGSKANIFHETHWWRFLYGTLINIVSLITCLLGSSLFSVAAFFYIYTLNTYAYNNEALLYNKTDLLYGHYTSFSSTTMRENLFSNYTIDYTTGNTMNFATVFGVLFSSITGLLAGANMS
ncbi:unnamed protein product, partial [Rotaria sp. Silwood1]